MLPNSADGFDLCTQYQRRKRESGIVGGQMIVLEPLCCEDMVLETEAGGP